MNSYSDLPVWHLAQDFVAFCNAVTESFPGGPNSGLASQIRRAAMSVADAISEADGREQTAFFAQCLRAAQGSVKETETHLGLAARVGLVEQSALQIAMAKCGDIRTSLRSQRQAIEDTQ